MWRTLLGDAGVVISGSLDENNSSPREDHNTSTSLFRANDVPRVLDLWCWDLKAARISRPDSLVAETYARKSRASRNRFEKNPLPQILSIPVLLRDS